MRSDLTTWADNKNAMNIWQYLDENLMDLDFHSAQDPEPENGPTEKWAAQNKEQILADLVEILDRSGKTGNKTKLLIDFINRERKATTAIGQGIAIPHIRTMQAKELIIGIARSRVGLQFDSLDKDPVHFFFVMAAPPYDDSLYLKVFKALSENLQYDQFREDLMEAREPYDFIRIFRQYEG